jgi:hypothetical protein
MDLRLIPADKHLLHAIVQADVERRMLHIAQECNIAQRLIQPASQRADDQNVTRLELDGMSNGELKIGLILVVRIKLYGDIGLTKRLQVFPFGRIHVADDEIGLNAKSQGMTRAAVCTEDEIILP